jgi:hypothetical protein
MRVPAEDPEGLCGAGGDQGGGGQGAAELAHDACGLQAVADDIAYGHGDLVAVLELDQVVPVATDIEGADRGPVADGEPVMADRGRNGEHGALQGEGDLTLAGVGATQALVDFVQLPHPAEELGLELA